MTLMMVLAVVFCLAIGFIAGRASVKRMSRHTSDGSGRGGRTRKH